MKALHNLVPIKLTLMLITCQTMFAMETDHKAVEEKCPFVLNAVQLSEEDASLQNSYKTLKHFFESKEITDYASAAQYGREHSAINDPEQVSEELAPFFKKNQTDQYTPNTHYQALIFNTSGIDVFMERLAFLARMNKNGVKADKLIALVGSHKHREDLKDPEYLNQLPTLFESDFNVSNSTSQISQEERANWETHRDGMEVAWQLVSSDPDMADLRTRFSYYDGDGEPLRTEALLQHFIKNGIEHDIDEAHPIGFIANAQGAAKLEKMVKKYLGANPHVEMLAARPIEDAKEGKLFNDPPQQRALTKIYHFYRILETLVTK